MYSQISYNQFNSHNGVPLASGKIVFKEHNQSTGSTHTFKDEALTLPCYQFRLNSRGCADVYVDTAVSVDAYLFDIKGNLVDSWINIPLAETSDVIASHIADRNNPHQVTAFQVGAYTREETDTRIAEASSSAGTFLGNLAPDTLNAKISAHQTHLNDHAVMSQPGMVVWETETSQEYIDVAQYDHVICTNSGWNIIGQPKWGLNVSGTTFSVAPF